jgi:DNA-binding transcriptional regulator PaaX
MKKERSITNYLLAAVGLVGLMFVGALAPNVFVAFGAFIPKAKYSKRQIINACYYAKKSKLVSVAYDREKTIIKLTKEGKEKLLKFRFDGLKLQIQKKWDKKWRLVVFDIPENHKQGRNAFSAKLREMGFFQFQKSVWITPYPCEDEIDFIKEIYEIRNFVRVITAEKIDIQTDLMKYFSLR